MVGIKPVQHLLSVRQVADRLGVSTGFVRKEIASGRMVATISIRRPGGRTMRRVSEEDYRAYRDVWCGDSTTD